MINLTELKKACSELQMRTGISIEVCDPDLSVIFKCGKKNPLSNGDSPASVINPRTDKKYTIYAVSRDDEPLDEATLQLVSICLEPFFTTRSFADIFRDLVYSKIDKDIFCQLLSANGINAELMYRLYLIRCDEKQLRDIMYVTKEIIDTSSGDMLFSLNKENIILIKESSDEVSSDDADELASALLQSISLEAPGNSTFVAVSNVFNSLKDIDVAYKSASDALRVGSVCAGTENVFLAEKLRVELFLDMLPQSVLREFLAINSGKIISEAWGEKLIETVRTLFANDLNLSVAARELYINRNTLVYRLDKIKKISGLNLKSFDDAVMFKILMIIDKLVNE